MGWNFLLLYYSFWLKISWYAIGSVRFRNISTTTKFPYVLALHAWEKNFLRERVWYWLSLASRENHWGNMVAFVSWVPAVSICLLIDCLSCGDWLSFLRGPWLWATSLITTIEKRASRCPEIINRLYSLYVYTCFQTLRKVLSL